MSVKSIDDPNFTEVLDAGTYADSHAVNCSHEQLDLYGTDGFRADLNVNLGTKDGLLGGQEKGESEFAEEDNKNDKQKSLIRCQIAFGGAAWQPIEAIVADLGNLGELGIKGYGSTPEKGIEVKELLEQAAQHNPDGLEDALKYAKRDHNGNILATAEDVYNYEAEYEMACTVAISGEQAANIANGEHDPNAESQLSYMKGIESGPNGATDFGITGFGGNGG